MRFIRSVFALWLGIIVLLSTAILYVHTPIEPNPNSLQNLKLDLCDGNPCFMEITPGVTRWDAAKMIASHQGVNIENVFQFGSADAVEIIHGFGDTVANIEIDTVSSKPDRPLVRDYILKYGTPCKLSDFGSPYGVTLIYPHLLVSIGQSVERVSPYLQVSELQIIDPTIIAPPTTDLCISKIIQDSPTVDWAGFRSIRYYELKGLIHQR